MTVRPSTKHNIQRDDENTTRPGFAVVQKILVTGSIFVESTGIDSGTGDVLLLVSGTVTNGDNHNHFGGDGGPIPEAIASAITVGSNKNPPVAADSLAINDTEDGNSFKRLTLGTLRSFLRTSFDTVYAPITGAFVQDEGVIKGRVTTFNFVGTPVDVSVSGSVARIFVTGSGGGVQLSVDSPRVYTNSGTWSKPAGLQYVIVELVGGGGGSGAAEGTASEAAIGGPGGGGEYAKGRLDTGDLGSTENIGIGKGGIAGTTPSGAGGDGGTSFFGSHITAAGGAGGNGQTSSTSVPRSGGSGGVGGSGGTGGDIRVGGNAGQNGLILTIANLVTSIGGGNPLGGTSRTTGANVAGQAGSSYGGGAAGANTTNNATDRAGAAGGDGVVIVWEYVSG